MSTWPKYDGGAIVGYEGGPEGQGATVITNASRGRAFAALHASEDSKRGIVRKKLPQHLNNDQGASMNRQDMEECMKEGRAAMEREQRMEKLRARVESEYRPCWCPLLVIRKGPRPAVDHKACTGVDGAAVAPTEYEEMEVQIPAGKVPGQQFKVQTPAGVMTVAVPAGMEAGQALGIQVPVPTASYEAKQDANCCLLS